jgi:SPOC domain
MPSPPIRCAVDAQLVAGRPPDFREPTFWASLFTSPSLNVEGRVPVPAARNYLLDSRLNSGRELVAVVFEPRQESDRANFDQLVQFLLVKE